MPSTLRLSVVTAAIVLLTAGVWGPAGAQSNAQGLIDELRNLIERGEQRRSADRDFLRALRDLVRRYDRPWQVPLFNDDFADGDFQRSPSWTVLAGDFWVEAGALKSHVQPARPETPPASGEGDTAARLFGAILEEALKGERSTEPRTSGGEGTPRAAIKTEVKISNAFALSMELSALARDTGTRQLVFGPYQGADAGLGYRLAYVSDAGDGGPSLQMLRVFSRGSSVIDASDRVGDLADGRVHNVNWTRDRSGEMVVTVDGNEVLRVVDRGFRDPFQGLVIENLGGRFGVHSVAVDGVRR